MQKREAIEAIVTAFRYAGFMASAVSCGSNEYEVTDPTASGYDKYRNLGRMKFIKGEGWQIQPFDGGWYKPIYTNKKVYDIGTAAKEIMRCQRENREKERQANATE